MEFKILLYIVGIIIYFFYSGSKAVKKKKEEMRRAEPQQRKKTWEEELREILTQKAETGKNEIPYEERERREVEAPKEEWIDAVPYKSAAVEYAENKVAEMRNNLSNQAYSIENDPTPLSEKLAELNKSIKKQETPASVGNEVVHDEPFDAQKAFIYSEIFRPKYNQSNEFA